MHTKSTEVSYNNRHKYISRLLKKNLVGLEFLKMGKLSEQMY